MARDELETFKIIEDEDFPCVEDNVFDNELSLEKRTKHEKFKQMTL